MAFDYKSWLKQAEDRLAYLHQQRYLIDAEIFQLQRGIASFKPLAEDLEAWRGMDVGFTQAVRDIVSVFPTNGVAATAIRDEMVNRGVKLEQANPLAAIHQTLARLMEKEEIEEIPQATGKPKYRVKTAANALLRASEKAAKGQPSGLQGIGVHVLKGKRIK
jgi:hypothetical protein